MRGSFLARWRDAGLLSALVVLTFGLLLGYGYWRHGTAMYQEGFEAGRVGYETAYQQGRDAGEMAGRSDMFVPLAAGECSVKSRDGKRGDKMPCYRINRGGWYVPSPAELRKPG